MSAVDVLDIGTASGQNHFKLQWNPDPPPTGTPLETDPGSVTEQPPYFELSPEGTAARMRVSMNGSRTSTYPRTEWREMNEAGTSEMAFDTSTGDHWLWLPWRVLHLPPVKPTLNVLQLHGGDAEGDRAQITTELDNGVVKLKFRLNGTSSGQPLLEDPLVLNKWYHTRLRVLDGQVYLYHQGQLVPIVGNITNHSVTAYFKCGCYPNSNDTIDSASEYALMEMARPMHWHTGWANPRPLVAGGFGDGEVTYVGAGTASVVDTGATTPGLPAGLEDGDVLLMIDHITDNLTSGDAPAPSTPAGWTQKAMEVHAGPQNDGARTSLRQTLFWQRWTTGTAAPTVGMSGGSDVGHRTRIFAVRGAIADGDPTDVLGTIFKGPSAETDVGPIPGVSGLTPGSMVFVIGFGNDNWSDSDGVVATLTGDGLTWAEAEDYIVSVTSMADQGGVVAYAQVPAGGDVTSKTFNVTNLYNFTSMGRMWAIRPPSSPPTGNWLAFF